MSSRERILATLRANRRPFEDAAPRPTPYLPVTRLGDGDLAVLFRSVVEARSGKVYLSADTQAAVETVLTLIGADRVVVAWKELPLPGLAEALAARGIEMIVPYARGEGRIAALEQAEPVRLGITGADAGFATTGTLVLTSTSTQGRISSLLPPVHVALLRRDRLFPRIEDWLTGAARQTLAAARNAVLVTGPSSTGDIESHVILGAHGPEAVHIVVF